MPPLQTTSDANRLIKRPRGRPRKGEDERDDGNRRLELLAAAARLFRQQGYSATTTRGIAAAAGMQSGSPFYHFKSKDALLFAVMEEGMRTALQRQETALRAAEQQHLSPVERMRILVQVHFEVLLGPGNDFVPVMLYEARALQAHQRKALAELIDAYESLWDPVLVQLHDAGQLKAPVRLSRLLILGALNWSVQWFDARKGGSLQALTDAAMALFVKEC